MFCLLRFLLDPEHVQPSQTLQSMLRALWTGQAIQRLASVLNKTLKDKQRTHNWNMEALSNLGILDRINELAERGDATHLMERMGAGEPTEGSKEAEEEPAQVGTVDVNDTAFLEELQGACDNAKTTWANLSFVGPRLNHQFCTILENFPCADHKCAVAKQKGGGKMFCLVRFMLDPRHVRPEMKQGAIQRCIQQGGTFRGLLESFLKVFDEKRSSHQWGTTQLDKLGVIQHLKSMLRGDVPLPSMGAPAPSMPTHPKAEQTPQQRRKGSQAKDASSQEMNAISTPASLPAGTSPAPASDHPPHAMPPRPRGPQPGTTSTTIPLRADPRSQSVPLPSSDPAASAAAIAAATAVSQVKPPG